MRLAPCVVVALGARLVLNVTRDSGYTAGMDGTYAQNYQDTWMMAMAKRNGWDQPGKGFILDMGAYHGTECSNSALLEKQLNYKGVCVEPQPVGFEDRRCVLAARAMGSESNQKVRFFGQGQLKHKGKRSWEDAPGDGGFDVETISPRDLFACVERKEVAGLDCSGVSGHAEIPRFIPFASLDVEGSEADVLKSFPWDEHQVGAWVVEQTANASRPAGAREATRDLLRAQGYMQAPVENPGVDEYWVLPPYWDKSLARKPWRTHPSGSNGC
jgi:hypothetical protein